MKIDYMLLLIFLMGVTFGCKTKSVPSKKTTNIGTLELFALVKSKDVIALQKLITKENVNAIDSNGVSLLSRAVLTNDFNTVKLLIEKGADPNLHNNTKSKSTPLMMCSNHNLVKTAEYLLKKGADIDLPDSNGDAVINWAAYMGKYDFTKMLLDNGAKTNQKSIHSDNAIGVALKEWQDSIVELFIDYGKGIYTVENANKPLIRAVKKDDLTYLKKNLTKENSNLKDEAGNSLLIIAAGRGDFDLVKLLIKKGATIDILNVVGHTALNKAVWAKHNDIAKYLITRDADVNLTDTRFSLTPLIAAARKNNVEMGKILIEKGAKINTTNSIDNFSPLMWAVGYGHIDFVKLLMQYKPDLTIISKYGNDVFKMARKDEILKLLKKE